jgi:arabinogalactan endo-1,4-beta-galactosidase
VCDENGNSLSTLSMSMANWTWRTENELIYSNVGNNSLRSYNFIDSSIQVILNHPGIGPSGDHLTINHNNELYTQIDEGLIRVNLSTGDFEIVDTNYYTYNSGYAQQLTDSKILLQRIIGDTTFFQDCILYEATYISILDEATGEEKRIKIPE